MITRYKVFDEFNKDITNIVDIKGEEEGFKVINEFGVDITSIVSIKKVTL